MPTFDIDRDLREAHALLCPEQIGSRAELPPSEVRNLRIRLITEEMTEIDEAIHAHDIVEFADGVADTLYVAVGTAVACGIDISSAWKEARGGDDPFQDILDRVRESGHMPSSVGLPLGEGRVAEVLFTQAYVKASLASARLFTALEGDDVSACVEPLLLIVASMCELSVRAGIDLRPVWHEVHRSNMAKKGGTRRTDGKFMKPPGWTPPDIKGVLESQKTLG